MSRVYHPTPSGQIDPHNGQPLYFQGYTDSHEGFNYSFEANAHIAPLAPIDQARAIAQELTNAHQSQTQN